MSTPAEITPDNIDNLNSAPEQEVETVDYSKWNKSQLHAELKRRNLAFDVEAVNKSLAAQLEADDAINNVSLDVQNPLGAENVDANVPSEVTNASNNVPAEAGVQAAALHKVTQERLLKQPLVTMVIPMEDGDKDGATVEVGINGVNYSIPKGQVVELPMQVAQLLADSFKITLNAGKAWRIDRDQIKSGVAVQAALS